MDKNEYEIQHFGFSATQIGLERNHILRKLLSKALESMLKKLSTSADTAQLLSQQKDEVQANCMQTFDPQLLAMEALDAKCFTIPQNVLLTEDFDQTKGYTEYDEQHLDEELAALKQLFLENSIMIASLKMENSQHDSIASVINEELHVHAQIQGVSKAFDFQKLQRMTYNTLQFIKEF